MCLRDLEHRTQIIAGPDTGAAGDGDNTRRCVARRNIRPDCCVKSVGIHGKMWPLGRQLDQVRLPDPGNPARPVD